MRIGVQRKIRVDVGVAVNRHTGTAQSHVHGQTAGKDLRRIIISGPVKPEYTSVRRHEAALYDRMTAQIRVNAAAILHQIRPIKGAERCHILRTAHGNEGIGIMFAPCFDQFCLCFSKRKCLKFTMIKP